jgi:hypothetical protein
MLNALTPIDTRKAFRQIHRIIYQSMNINIRRPSVL